MNSTLLDGYHETYWRYELCASGGVVSKTTFDQTKD